MEAQVKVEVDRWGERWRGGEGSTWIPPPSVSAMSRNLSHEPASVDGLHADSMIVWMLSSLSFFALLFFRAAVTCSCTAVMSCWHTPHRMYLTSEGTAASSSGRHAARRSSAASAARRRSTLANISVALPEATERALGGVAARASSWREGGTSSGLPATRRPSVTPEVFRVFYVPDCLLAEGAAPRRNRDRDLRCGADGGLYPIPYTTSWRRLEIEKPPIHHFRGVERQ